MNFPPRFPPDWLEWLGLAVGLGGFAWGLTAGGIEASHRRGLRVLAAHGAVAMGLCLFAGAAAWRMLEPPIRLSGVVVSVSTDRDKQGRPTGTQFQFRDDHGMDWSFSTEYNSHLKAQTEVRVTVLKYGDPVVSVEGRDSDGLPYSFENEYGIAPFGYGFFGVLILGAGVFRYMTDPDASSLDEDRDTRQVAEGVDQKSLLHLADRRRDDEEVDARQVAVGIDHKSLLHLSDHGRESE